MCTNHLTDGRCLAFPEGIPQKIRDGKNDHTEKYPDQENDILFDPVYKKFQ